MELLIYLFSILFILVIYTVVSTIIKFSLFLTTRYKYENYRLFLPTVFTIISWIILSFCLNFVIEKTTNMSLFTLLFNHIIKIENINNYSTTLILVFVSHILMCIILQSFTYFLTNVDIKKGWDYLRFGIKKTFKSIFMKFKKQSSNECTDKNNENQNVAEIKPNTNNNKSQINIIEPLENLNFISALISSLLSTSLIVVFVIGLFILGVSISTKIL